jgi:hypothetical protein
MMDDGITLTDLLTLITIWETAFDNQDLATTVERKLEALKETNHNFSIYYVEFQ